MTIWMVVGVHKERWWSNVIQNFRRQSFRDKGLIIVLNGECREIPSVVVQGAFVTNSNADPASVMNRAIEWLGMNASPDDWFCKCDADDYYGPQYLQHVAEHTDCDFSGLHSIYVKSQDNRLWFADGNARTSIVHGPTIAARISTASLFHEGLDWGEDTVWCQRMRDSGKRCSIRPPDNFCYQRWAGYQHTWPCTDEELLAAWPIPMYEIGHFDEDVVNGTKPHKYSRLLEEREFNLSNSMPVRILLSRLHSQENVGVK